ncbi:hypothetical protein PspLS_05477, partial [Pyricularia sp. CBS 133598]
SLCAHRVLVKSEFHWSKESKSILNGPGLSVSVPKGVLAVVSVKLPIKQAQAGRSGCKVPLCPGLSQSALIEADGLQAGRWLGGRSQGLWFLHRHDPKVSLVQLRKVTMMLSSNVYGQRLLVMCRAIPERLSYPSRSRLFLLTHFAANSIPLVHHQEECSSNHCTTWQGPASAFEKRQPSRAPVEVESIGVVRAPMRLVVNVP